MSIIDAGGISQPVEAPIDALTFVLKIRAVGALFLEDSWTQ
jgi:hypothetical protein